MDSMQQLGSGPTTGPKSMLATTQNVALTIICSVNLEAIQVKWVGWYSLARVLSPPLKLGQILADFQSSGILWEVRLLLIKNKGGT